MKMFVATDKKVLIQGWFLQHQFFPCYSAKMKELFLKCSIKVYSNLIKINATNWTLTSQDQKKQLKKLISGLHQNMIVIPVPSLSSCL
jgi:hypothetical protein